MKESNSKAQVHIFLGTGGVGKTTLSAAFAMGLAKTGFKTLIITIDPSQRLKSTLSLKTVAQNQKVLELGTGSLWGSILDHKWIFDSFVSRSLKDPILTQNLYRNRLYQKLSTDLSGTQEFTSLEKLLSEWQSQEWEHIVLDTPPFQHALDFLSAPQKLSKLLDDRIARWFRRPEKIFTLSLQHVVAFSTRHLLKALEILTGSEFMTELADFFGQIHFWQTQLQARLKEVQALLSDRQCSFYLVSSLYRPKVQETLEVLKVMEIYNYQCPWIIWNRSHPLWFDRDLAEWVEKNPSSKEWYGNWAQVFAQRSMEARENLSREHWRFKVRSLEIPEMLGAENESWDLLERLLPQLAPMIPSIKNQ